MGLQLVLALLLCISSAWADTKNPFIEDNRQHIFPGGIGLPGPLQATCADIIPPATPTTGEVLYCKAGSGWCAKDSLGTERCTGGGGGGGSGTMTDLTCGAGLTCTPNPVITSGTVAIGAGQVTDAMLANNYSGIGTCTNQFPRTLNDNAPPTCASVSLTADVTGTLLIGNGGTGQTTATAAFNALDPLTTRGDLLTHNGTNSVRLPIGGSGTFLATDGVDAFWAGVSAVGSITCGTALTCAPGNPITSTGTISLSTVADDNILVSTGATWQAKAIPLSTGVGQVLQYDTASNSFSAHTLVDADIPDTITLSNITQIATRSHSSLQNLSADDHTQYLLLAGRSPVQTMAGQYRIGSGTNGGLDIDADIASSSIGLFIEKNVGTPIVGPAQAFLSIVTSAVADSPSLLMQASNALAGTDAVFAMRHSRGTYAAPTATQSADILGTFAIQGYGNGTFSGTSLADASLEFYAAETFDATHRGTTAKFYTTKSAQTALSVVWQTNTSASMTIPVGLRIGDTSPPTQALENVGQTRIFALDRTWPAVDTPPLLMNNAYTATAATTAPRFALWQGTITYTGAPSPAGHAPVMAEYAPAITLNYTGTYAGGVGFATVPTVTVSNGQTITLPALESDFYASTTYQKASGGTGALDAAATHSSFIATGAVGGVATTTGVAMKRWNGYVSLGPNLQNGGTVDENVLFLANATAVGTSLIAGFRSDIASGTGRWAFQGSGTAVSGFGGAVRIGDTTAPTTTSGLEVVGVVKPRIANDTNPGIVDAIVWAPTQTYSAGGSGVRVLRAAPTVTISGTGASADSVIDSSGTYNIGAGSSSMTAIYSHPTYNYTAAVAALGLIPTTYLDQSIYNASNVAAGTSNAAVTFTSFAADPEFKASGASGTVTFDTVREMKAGGRLTTDNAAGTVTVTNLIHYAIIAATNSGAGTETVTTEVGLDVPDFALAGTKIGIRSAGSAVEQRWAGSAVFGANAAPTNASTGLEVSSTTKAFLMSRMTQAQMAALTAANGMVVYCTDCVNTCLAGAGAGFACLREGGAWRLL
jgi:hypothetical protein